MKRIIGLLRNPFRKTIVLEKNDTDEIMQESVDEISNGSLDNLDVESNSISEEIVVSHPTTAFFGYQENISKDDLKTYIHSKASEYLLMDISYYNIIKAGQGYYWELHEGGSNKGALNSILHLLNDLNHKEVHLKTTSRTIRITKKRNAPGIDAFNLNENTIVDQTNGVEFKDKMTPVTSNGTGLMMFGAIFSLLSVIFLLLAVTFKYAVINKSESVDTGESISKSPISQVKKIKEVLNIEGVYIDHITMNKNGDYVIKTLTEKGQINNDSTITSPEIVNQ